MIEIPPPNGVDAAGADAIATASPPSGPLAPSSAPKLIERPANGFAALSPRSGSAPLREAWAPSVRGWVGSVIEAIVVRVGCSCAPQL